MHGFLVYIDTFLPFCVYDQNSLKICMRPDTETVRHEKGKMSGKILFLLDSMKDTQFNLNQFAKSVHNLN